MTVTFNPPTTNTVAGAVGQVPGDAQTDVYMLAYATINSLIEITNSLGVNTFNKLQQQGNIATEAKAQANAVQAQINKAKPDEKEKISADVQKWVTDNNIQIYGENGTESGALWLKNHDPASVADMNTLKSSIENHSQKALDSVNTVNLQVQQITQKMSYLISLLSNLLSARYDQSKGVVQNIR